MVPKDTRDHFISIKILMLELLLHRVERTAVRGSILIPLKSTLLSSVST